MSTGTNTPLKREAPEDIHRTLGFHFNGDGLSKGHTCVMTKKAILYGEAIAQSTLRRCEHSLSYNVFYMKILAYGSPATSVSFKECHNMQKPVVNVIPSKMEIIHKAAHEVVFGTTQYGGLGLNHLTMVQSHGQLQYLIDSLRCNGTLGQLIHMML
jgi:hypothetical protein